MDPSQKLVFVSSPLRGDVARNLAEARRYCRWLMRTRPGVVALAPHLLFTQFLDDAVPGEREMGIRAGLKLLEACSEMVAFTRKGVFSAGMVAERRAAESLGVPVTCLEVETLDL